MHPIVLSIILPVASPVAEPIPAHGDAVDLQLGYDRGALYLQHLAECAGGRKVVFAIERGGVIEVAADIGASSAQLVRADLNGDGKLDSERYVAYRIGRQDTPRFSGLSDGDTIKAYVLAQQSEPVLWDGTENVPGLVVSRVIERTFTSPLMTE